MCTTCLAGGDVHCASMSVFLNYALTDSMGFASLFHASFGHFLCTVLSCTVYFIITE